jgi:mannose-6-phosphate isomerase-like protein (cupin superfamily)
MKHLSTRGKRDFFKVLADGFSSQVAIMTLKPGQSSSDEVTDEHPGSEQWLLVMSGSGRARVGDGRLSLKEGSLLLIEKEEAHQISNTGKKPLVTLNFYAPAAYTKSGKVKRSAKTG